MLVVTACNRRYFDGVRVMWNSFKEHCEGHEFYCLAFGDRTLQGDLESLGINVKFNPTYPPGTVLTRKHTWLWSRYDDDAIKALYSRILLPSLFLDHDKMMWLDADANFIGSIDALDNFKFHGKVLAAPLTWKIDGVRRVRGERHGEHIRTGTLMFDAARFRDEGWLEKCYEVMNNEADKIDGSAVEFVINWAMRGQATELPTIYSYAAKNRKVHDGVSIIHWSIMEPWNEEMMKEKKKFARQQVETYWKRYDY